MDKRNEQINNIQIEAMKRALNPLMIFDPTESDMAKRIRLIPNKATGIGTEQGVPKSSGWWKAKQSVSAQRAAHK